jgi:hypothetical protein
MCKSSGQVADLATDWMCCWHAVQSLGDFGYGVLESNAN